MSLIDVLQLISCVATAILTAISGYHVTKTHKKTKIKKLSRSQKKAILIEYKKAQGGA